MKTLTLLRHAKAERDSPEGDFERALAPRGREAARRIGALLRTSGASFDLVLASPALRVMETISEAGVLSPTVDRRVYNASCATLLELVRSVDDSISNLMIAGHNPGISQLASLLGGEAGHGMPDDFPTGGLAQIAFAVDAWSEVNKGSGRLVRFVDPRQCD